MNIGEAQDVIARRKYRLSGGTSEPTEVLVSISRPAQIVNGDYECHYEVMFGGKRQQGRVQGIDEIDALVNVLAMAGSWLNGLNESTYGGRLTWAGGDDDLGLPRIERDWPFVKHNDEGAS